MKELFQKLSQIPQSFKENRLINEKRDVEKREPTDEEIFDEMVRKEEAKKRPKKPLAEYDARREEWEKEKLEEKEKRAEIEDEEEEDKEKEVDDINEALEYAEELMNEVSRVGKIKYELKFKSLKEISYGGKLSLLHYLKGLDRKGNRLKLFVDSKLSPEDEVELDEMQIKACKLISKVQIELFEKEKESEKWQNMGREYETKARRYFKKLNRSLNRMSGKECKKFVLYTAAFLDKGAVEHAKNFVAEMLTRKRREDVFTEYSERIPVEVAADVE